MSGGWIQTYTGRALCLTKPDPNAIVIEDIAFPLGKLVRYGGHCRNFFSVGEHCCLLSDQASPKNKLAGLMHDASEAYLVDLTRPVKALFPEYRVLENQWMAVIASKFNFDWPPPAEIKQLDDAMLATERLQAMAPMPAGDAALCWNPSAPAPLNISLQFWSPERAAIEFMTRFKTLTGGR